MPHDDWELAPVVTPEATHKSIPVRLDTVPQLAVDPVKLNCREVRESHLPPRQNEPLIPGRVEERCRTEDCDGGHDGELHGAVAHFSGQTNSTGPRECS